VANLTTLVGDVKYKDAPPGGVVHADLYQLLSYVVASGLPGGLLVYGAGGVSAVHQVALLAKRLEVAPGSHRAPGGDTAPGSGAGSKGQVAEGAVCCGGERRGGAQRAGPVAFGN
jgi:hypothetical protein